jgi:hypothetical protein
MVVKSRNVSARRSRAMCPKGTGSGGMNDVGGFYWDCKRIKWSKQGCITGAINERMNGRRTQGRNQ